MALTQLAVSPAGVGLNRTFATPADSPGVVAWPSTLSTMARLVPVREYRSSHSPLKCVTRRPSVAPTWSRREKDAGWTRIRFSGRTSVAFSSGWKLVARFARGNMQARRMFSARAPVTSEVPIATPVPHRRTQLGYPAQPVQTRARRGRQFSLRGVVPPLNDGLHGPEQMTLGFRIHLLSHCENFVFPQRCRGAVVVTKSLLKWQAPPCRRSAGPAHCI